MLEKISQGSPLHPRARASAFWEYAGAVADPAFEKEAWLSDVLLSYGECGFTVGEEATVLFCSRDDAPGASKLPTAPVSEDADIITSLFINSARAGRGLEAVLLDAAIMALTERGVGAVEAFGFYGHPDVSAATQYLGTKPALIGLMPFEVLIGAGFEVAADHPVVPRLRLELPPAHDLLSAAAVEDLLAKALA